MELERGKRKIIRDNSNILKWQKVGWNYPLKKSFQNKCVLNSSFMQKFRLNKEKFLYVLESIKANYKLHKGPLQFEQ